MSAKKTAAKKTAAKKTAAKSAPAVSPEIVADGTPVIFTELRTPIEGDLAIEPGVVVYISSFNEDDSSYNISKTPNGPGVETLYREEFRLATPEEISGKATAKPAKAAKATKTDAEADNGSTTKKDAKGRTVVAKKAAKKAAKKVAKPTAPVEPLPPVKLLASVKNTVTEQGGLIEAAVALADRSGITDFTLGGVLGKIQETAAFEALKDAEGNPKYGTGHLGFTRFIEQHLGMKYRKAQYLITNYITLTGLGITEKQIMGIGWSKLVQAVAVINADNAEEILAEAKAKPFEEFKQAMRQRKVDGGGSQHGNTKANLVTFRFALHNDKAAVATDALSRAKATLGIEGTDVAALSQAFDHILTEWLQLTAE